MREKGGRGAGLGGRKALINLTPPPPFFFPLGSFFLKQNQTWRLRSHPLPSPLFFGLFLGEREMVRFCFLIGWKVSLLGVQSYSLLFFLGFIFCFLRFLFHFFFFLLDFLSFCQYRHTILLPKVLFLFIFPPGRGGGGVCHFASISFLPGVSPTPPPTLVTGTDFHGQFFSSRP